MSGANGAPALDPAKPAIDGARRPAWDRSFRHHHSLADPALWPQRSKTVWLKGRDVQVGRTIFKCLWPPLNDPTLAFELYESEHKMTVCITSSNCYWPVTTTLSAASGFVTLGSPSVFCEFQAMLLQLPQSQGAGGLELKSLFIYSDKCHCGWSEDSRG